MSGRCAATTLTLGGRHVRWDELAAVDAVLADGSTVRLHHWRDLERSENDAGNPPTGLVTVTLPDGTAAHLGGVTAASLRGKYPPQLPVATRQRVAQVAESFTDDPALRRQLRDLLVTTGASTAAQMRAAVRNVFPGLDTALTTRIRNAYTDTFTPPALADLAGLRRPGPLDAPTIAGTLGTSSDELRRLDTLVAWTADGRVRAALAAHRIGDRPRQHSAGAHADVFAARALLRASREPSKRAVDAAGRWCHRCQMSVEVCTCSARLDDLSSFLRERVEVVRHPSRSATANRWADHFATRHTATTHVAARALRAEVRERVAAAVGASPDELDDALGPRWAMNVAVFAAQTGATVDQVAAAGPELVETLASVRVRARNLHGNYVHVLHREFYDPETRTVDEPANLVFLLRDGKYLRWAANGLDASRKVGAIGRERAAITRRNHRKVDLQISRYCDFVPDRHNALLGDPDRRTVYIDTGYAGSIPEHIESRRGLSLDDIAAARRGDGESFARLLSSHNPGYEFAGAMERVDVEMIEADAKDRRSATDIDEVPPPTSALEQLVFRQLRTTITEDAYLIGVGYQIAAADDDPDVAERLRRAGLRRSERTTSRWRRLLGGF